jgi:phytoene synthase
VSESSSAEAITKASKSNLALAFIALSRARRADITTFYAFCRIVDDIADSPGQSHADRQAALNLWKQAIIREVNLEPPLAAEMRKIIERYAIAPELFLEIIAGVEMDLVPARFETFEALRVYCYRVASAVGLVSIEIFGYKDKSCRRYATDLGMALQITNILRDVGVDLDNGGRVYLPTADMQRFGYSAEDLLARRHNEQFLELMIFEADRAIGFYQSANAHLPAVDRKSMIAAEIMRRVYSRLLRRMRHDHFQVFEKKYALGKLSKLEIIASTLLRNIF